MKRTFTLPKLLTLCVVTMFAFFESSFAQPSIGTSTFNNTSTLAASGASPKTGTTEGWTFTIYSAVNCAITNSIGNVNLISTPITTGIWQHATIASSDGSAFKLDSFHFHVLTAAFTGHTLTIAGYRSGVLQGSTTTSSIAATGTTYLVDVSTNANFNNIDEITITPSGSTAQGTLAFEDITIDDAINPLPVIWLTPLSVKMNNGKPLIQWTATQQGNPDFIIQRSFDGAHFDNIGKVSSTTQTNYSYNDQDNFFQNGNIYYRINEVEKDGTNNFSNIVFISIDNTSIKIYPNPALDKVNITGLPLGETIEIIDVSGKVVFKTQSNVSTEISLEHCSSGDYFIKSKSLKTPIKIVKQ